MASSSVEGSHQLGNWGITGLSRLGHPEVPGPGDGTPGPQSSGPFAPGCPASPKARGEMNQRQHRAKGQLLTPQWNLETSRRGGSQTPLRSLSQPVSSSFSPHSKLLPGRNDSLHLDAEEVRLREVAAEGSKGAQLTTKPSFLPCPVVLKQEEDEEGQTQRFTALNTR